MCMGSSQIVNVYGTGPNGGTHSEKSISMPKNCKLVSAANPQGSTAEEICRAVQGSGLPGAQSCNFVAVGYSYGSENNIWRAMCAGTVPPVPAKPPVATPPTQSPVVLPPQPVVEDPYIDCQVQCNPQTLRAVIYGTYGSVAASIVSNKNCKAYVATTNPLGASNAELCAFVKNSGLQRASLCKKVTTNYNYNGVIGTRIANCQ